MKKILLFTLCAAFALCIGNLNAQNVRSMSGQEMSKSTATVFSLQSANGVAKTPTNRDVIFSEDFESASGESLPTGWTSEGTAWFTSSGTVPGCTDPLDAHSGIKCMARSWNAAGTTNWAFTPGFALAVASYEISFWYQAPGYTAYGENDDFEVKIGTTPTSAGMSSATVVHSNINNNTAPFGEWFQKTFTFTSTSAGTYYLAFHDLTPNGEGFWVAIDDIEITGDAAGDPCPAVTNLTADVQGTDVKLTWTAATGEPTGYKIYNGSTELTTVTTTEYVVANLPNGEHTLIVEALFTDDCIPVKVSVTVTIKSGNPITNLEGNCGEDDELLTLTWDAPGAKGSRDLFWLTYSAETMADQSGIGLTNGGDIMAGARFTATDLADKGVQTGHTINSLQINMATAGVSNVSLKIWEGGSSVTDAGTLVVDQPIDISTINDEAWTTIDLTTPWVIDASKELRIGYGATHSAGTFPILFDDGPRVPNKSDLLYAGSWTTLYDALSYNRNAAIKAGIESEVILPEVVLYHVYQDDVKFGETETTTFTATENIKGEHEYCIVAEYNTGALSAKECKVIECKDISIKDHEMTFSIFPNPANNNITIESTTPFNKVEIVNFLGQTVYSQNNNGETTNIDVSNLNGGIYFVRIVTETGASVQKFVKK